MAQRRETLVLATGIALLCQLAQAIDVGDSSNSNDYSPFRTLNGNDGSNAGVTPVEKQQESNDLTLQPLIADDNSDQTQGGSDSDGLPTSSIIAIALGSVILVSLVVLLVVLRRSRSRPDQSDSDLPSNSNQPPENSRFCMKRMTWAVPEPGRSGLGDIDSSGSLVPVLEDTASRRKMREESQLEPKNSWAEISAATTSYSVAPLSTRHTRPAVPMLIYAPVRGRGFNDSHAPSDYSSHTDDYSIGMLESPVSTEYSFGSERDDVFLSTPWDEVDSYRSMDYTFLSTTSSDVFGSSRGKNGGGGAWKQVYGPTDTPPVGTGQSPLSSGVLFVRSIDPASMQRMCLDTRAHGTRNKNQMRFCVEI